MHADELIVDLPTVRKLLAEQFAPVAALPLKAVASQGTDNWLFRLGHPMCVRLPRRAAAAAAVEREWRWLPILAPGLPLEKPLPLFFGQSGQGYPFNWMVTRWIEGDDAAWLRGVGWALSVALVQLPYYRKTSLAITRMALSAIRALLSEGNS